MATSIIKCPSNILADYTNLSSYTESNPFIAPSDGYAFVYNTSSQSGYISIRGSGGATYEVACGAFGGRTATFVRRGMRLFVTGTTSAARFVPFV